MYFSSAAKGFSFLSSLKETKQRKVRNVFEMYSRRYEARRAVLGFAACYRRDARMFSRGRRPATRSRRDHGSPRRKGQTFTTEGEGGGLQIPLLHPAELKIRLNGVLFKKDGGINPHPHRRRECRHLCHHRGCYHRRYSVSPLLGRGRGRSCCYRASPRTPRHSPDSWHSRTSG